MASAFAKDGWEALTCSSGEYEHEMARTNGRRDFEAWLDGHPEWTLGMHCPAYTHREPDNKIGSRRSEFSDASWRSTERQLDSPDSPVLERIIEDTPLDESEHPDSPVPRSQQTPPKKEAKIFIEEKPARPPLSSLSSLSRRAASSTDSDNQPPTSLGPRTPSTPAGKQALHKQKSSNVLAASKPASSTSLPFPSELVATASEKRFHAQNLMHALTERGVLTELGPKKAWGFVLKSKTSSPNIQLSELRVAGDVMEAIKEFGYLEFASWDYSELERQGYTDLASSLGAARILVERWIKGAWESIAVFGDANEVRVFTSRVAATPQTPSPRKRKGQNV